ncbi:MFS general substrate transporter [Pholiota conissans]|uniref:MFS general substrate transporter n=1 Tax=Pholiota conissans TaxID=109636 RepID=A0A9P6CXV4_9AGAR|nr:MFS general substrate transporter [Pholiota conissans]
MADATEKGSAYNSGSGSDNGSREQVALYQRPTGLKGFYYHPVTQVVMLGFVCFMGPGLFNALNGLGGGGKFDATTGANANVALYSTFAVSAFFAGTINNKLGSRLTLLLGTTGYSLYIGSFLASNIHANAGPFVITAGAILGVCAGLLWSAQGSLMLGYATEGQKGVFIGIFWGIFNLGAVVGAAVSLGENINNKANAVGNGTYIGFLILTLIGVTIPMTMADPDKMVRTDGTKVTVGTHRSWKVELYGLYLTLVKDPMIIMLFPMFLASNWFYTWQFNDYNGAIFNARTRSLNDFLYWLSQMFGSIAIGALLDRKRLSRRVRAFSGWGILVVMVFLVHIWAYFYQRNYTRADFTEDSVKIDFKNPEYGGRVVLYIFCGLLDAMWQTTAYWLMGAMSNDPAKLANFTGFYKAIQSAGGAGSWRVDAQKRPYMNLFISTWVLLAAGLVCTLPMIHLRVKNHTDLEEETLMRMDSEGQLHDASEIRAAETAQPPSEKEKA